jgi:hypothetical protein
VLSGRLTTDAFISVIRLCIASETIYLYPAENIEHSVFNVQLYTEDLQDQSEYIYSVF